tara:strand:- start:1249 stop:1707 length:459 start_codon:yes stop_codon:yes gene_type:complete
MDTRFSNTTFQEALIGAVKNLATRVYIESQRTVPVNTGRLKGSASLKHPGSPDKISVILYDTPYAEMVNQTQGASSGKLWGGVGDKTMQVSEHKRTYPSGKTVTVRKHEKKVGARPAGRGNGFLTKALQKELKTFVKTEFPDKEIEVQGLGF